VGGVLINVSDFGLGQGLKRKLLREERRGEEEKRRREEEKRRRGEESQHQRTKQKNEATSRPALSSFHVKRNKRIK
jgi:hypothetical protein|tara:strand:+ start:170 stop:397 length:228 start_codon:yes stop_codon:yes gene_type:complete